MKIVITGATGYIGSCLTDLALKDGHEVVIASRQKPLTFSAAWLFFDLSSVNPPVLPAQIDALVHLATHTEHADCLEQEREVAVAQSLIKSAQDTGAKFIFVSSQTAQENAPTSYGRIKWRIEQQVLAADGVVVRLGQVYGGAEQGLFGTLVRLVRRLPVLPAFVPSPLIQPIHVDDCATGLLTFIERDDLVSGVYSLAAADSVTFTDFLRAIAQHRLRKFKVFVPIPVPLVRFFIKLCGIKLSAKLGLHRLNSLFELPSMETAADLDAVGLKLRTLRSGMHPSGSDQRRRLIEEGMALLAYVLKVKPSSALVHRYVRMIEHLREGRPLPLPSWLFRWSVALALLDDRAFADSSLKKEFSWRVDASTVIAEASVQGAVRFLETTQAIQPLAAVAGMSLALSGDFFWRLSRLILSPLLMRVNKQGVF